MIQYSSTPIIYVLKAGLLSMLLLLIVFNSTATAQVAKKNEAISLKEGLKQMLQQEGAVKLKKLTVTVDAAQARELKKQHEVEAAGNYTVYRGLDDKDVVIGTVIIVNEQGKEGPLQVLVALRPEGAIYDVGFTIFGEDKGKSALSWGYLKQYLGKTSNDPITLGRDIDGVSGATWTSASVAASVKKAAVVYNTFVRTGE